MTTFTDVVNAAQGFVGNVVGNVVGNLVGTVTGSLVGNVTGNLLGNVQGNLNGYVVPPTAPYAANGAISIPAGNQSIQLTKAGVGAYTIVAPTAGTDDGKILFITTTTAQAHVITSSVDGFNAKGASGTATWAAAIGNSLTLMAYQGHWYVMALNGVTIA